MELLRTLVARIRNENLLWPLAVAVVAVIAGTRDALLFTLLIVVVAAGAIVVALQAVRESGSRRSPVRLALTFPDEALGTMIRRVDYELHDSENRLRHKGALAFAFDVNGWVCYLPRDIHPTDILRIEVTDHEQGRWDTVPFQPLYNRCVLREVSRG